MTDVALRSSLNIISLCTGGGGLDLGVELAIPDARSVVLVEGEAWSAATLVQAMETRLMAPAPVWSDVKTFDGRPWRGLVDGLIGGIPCQPHSLAGRKRGQHDERDLWSPTRRIIAQARPWLVLIENVRGMLSPGDDEVAGAERVWRDLQRLGFQVEIGLFTAAEVGASHERERVFILAVADFHGEGLAFGFQPDVGRGALRNEGPTPFPRRDELADTGRMRDERRGKPRNVVRETGSGESEGDQRQRDGIAADDGRTDLVDTASNGRREGRTEPELRSGRDTATGASAAMGDTMRAGLHAGTHRGIHSGEEISGPRDEDTDRSGDTVVDAISGRHDGQSQDAIGGSIGRTIIEWPGRDSFPALYPPGPSDIDGWRRVLAHSPHLEPAVRRMADGVAARLDLTGPHAARIERLRMLGNGVVPLQAAYAVRTLATRLARTSAGAARLVRMMT